MTTAAKPIFVRRRIATVSKENRIADRARIREMLGIKTTDERYRERIRNPQTAIRAFCIACTGGSMKDVAECTAPKCPLYPFRMGRNPYYGKPKGWQPTAEELANQTAAEEDEDLSTPADESESDDPSDQ